MLRSRKRVNCADSDVVYVVRDHDRFPTDLQFFWVELLRHQGATATVEEMAGRRIHRRRVRNDDQFDCIGAEGACVNPAAMLGGTKRRGPIQKLSRVTES